MIKKTKSGYVMDSVWRETVTEYSLTEKEQLTVRIGSFHQLRHTCGNCSSCDDPDVIALEAISPEGDSFWICDKCAEKFAPELFNEMIKERRILESKF
jgi:ribosomal protein L37AE/L43A